MYGSRPSPGPPQGHGGPPLPPGWVAEWVPQDQRYIFINQRTGEQTWNHPGQGPPSGYGPGYNSRSPPGYSSGPPPPQGYEQRPPQGYGPPGGGQHPPKDHSMAYGGLGLAAGLAGGAFMMHEHDKRKVFSPRR
jgi:hypothetical protein